MAKYLILCADTASDHKHVTGVRAAKWRPRKGGYKSPTYIARGVVAVRIASGDAFYTAAPRDAGGLAVSEVEVVQCSQAQCTTATIRTRGDASQSNNLDFMPCG